jgi:hypothetical protein
MRPLPIFTVAIGRGWLPLVSGVPDIECLALKRGLWPRSLSPEPVDERDEIGVGSRVDDDADV